jgi:hypothetical protein
VGGAVLEIPNGKSQNSTLKAFVASEIPNYKFQAGIEVGGMVRVTCENDPRSL